MSHEAFTAEHGHARVEVDGHRADVLIDRPDKRNAMNRAVVADLTAAFDHAFDVPLDDGLDVEGYLAAPLYDTHDHEEGFGARIEGREPAFEGR